MDKLWTLYIHIKSYRAAFFEYKTSLFSTISSLTNGYVTPQILLLSQLTTILNELANDEIMRGTKFSPAIRDGQEAIQYEIQLVLEVTHLPKGIFVVPGFRINSKKLFIIYQATHLYHLYDEGRKLPSTRIGALFLLSLLTNPISMNWAPLALNNAQDTIVNNFVVKVFPPPLTKHFFFYPFLFYNYDTPALVNRKI